jgi:hypothetical protein
MEVTVAQWLLRFYIFPQKLFEALSVILGNKEEETIKIFVPCKERCQKANKKILPIT